jgi:hypothetical protein
MRELLEPSCAYTRSRWQSFVDRQSDATLQGLHEMASLCVAASAIPDSRIPNLESFRVFGDQVQPFRDG